MDANIKLGLIIASGREGRFADRVVNWALARIAVDGRYDVVVIDPRVLGVTAWHYDMKPESLATLKSALGNSEAFLIIAAEYNHSFPASVKSIIDAGKEEWEAKPVAFLSYGGISGGLRSVEGLRLVLAALHAVTLSDTVSFVAPFQRFAEDGTLTDPKEEEMATTLLLNRLAWWAKSLTSARAVVPYADSAVAQASSI